MLWMKSPSGQFSCAGVTGNGHITYYVYVTLLSGVHVTGIYTCTIGYVHTAYTHLLQFLLLVFPANSAICISCLGFMACRYLRAHLCHFLLCLYSNITLYMHANVMWDLIHQIPNCSYVVLASHRHLIFLIVHVYMFSRAYWPLSYTFSTARFKWSNPHVYSYYLCHDTSYYRCTCRCCTYTISTHMYMYHAVHMYNLLYLRESIH